MLTTTVGGTTSGYWETGSPKYASPPSSVIRMLSTAAKMGRWMKKLEDMREGGKWKLRGGRRWGRVQGNESEHSATNYREEALCEDC